MQRFALLGCLLAVLLLPFRMAVAANVAPNVVNRCIAVVNGEMITQYDFEMAVGAELVQNHVDPGNADKIEAIRQRTLEAMIMDIIVTQEAERFNIRASDADIDAEIGRMIMHSKMSEDEFYRQMSEQKITREKIRERVRNRMLQQRLLSNMVGRKVVVSKEEVQKYFEEHGAYSTDRKMDLALIVYADADHAAAWGQRVRKGEVSFEDAAGQASVGPNRSRGGRIGQVSWSDLHPALQEQLSGMQPGQVSDVFSMNGMNTQIKLVDTVEEKAVQSLEEATPMIEEMLRRPKLEQRYKEYLSQLRKKARVDIRL